MKKYYTHDNGGRPFKVTIDKNKVFVYLIDEKNDTEVNDILYHEKPKFKFIAQKIFIGIHGFIYFIKTS
jgi:hypothetical protein